MTSKNRNSIKESPAGGWKDMLRKECFQRLEAERSRLLHRARNARSQGGTQPIVHAALRDIVQASSDHLGTSRPTLHGDRDVSSLSTPLPSGHSSTGADLATPPTMDANALNTSCKHNNSFQGDIFSNFFALSATEYEELMHSLEESLYADLLQEEADYLDSLERCEMEDWVESHLRAEGGGQDGPTVLCPVCKNAWLVQRQGVILCPGKDLRLDINIEGLHLSDLRRRLGEVIDAHSRRGCAAIPAFGQQGGSSARAGNCLVMHCGVCGSLELVM